MERQIGATESLETALKLRASTVRSVAIAQKAIGQKTIRPKAIRVDQVALWSLLFDFTNSKLLFLFFVIMSITGLICGCCIV